MSEAVARVLELFRQTAKQSVTGVTHVTGRQVTPKSSLVTPVTPVAYRNQVVPIEQVLRLGRAAFDVYDVEERSAIALHEGGIPEVYVDAFARLQTAQPIGVDHSRWLQVVDDAGRFLDRWGPAADLLRWSAQDLFHHLRREPQQRLLATPGSAGSLRVHCEILMPQGLTDPQIIDEGFDRHILLHEIGDVEVVGGGAELPPLRVDGDQHFGCDAICSAGALYAPTKCLAI